MEQEDKNQLLIDILLEKVNDLKEDLETANNSRTFWIDSYMERTNELARLKAATKPKRGRPVKKRGPGRPKKVK